MKLVIATALVASLSLFAGCATDNDGEGGASTYGLRPAKPSPGDPHGPLQTVNPAIIDLLNDDVSDPKGDLTLNRDGQLIVETIPSPIAIRGIDICRGCDLVVVRDPIRPDELNVIDDVGKLFCRIWLDDNYQVVTSDCQ